MENEPLVQATRASLDSLDVAEAGHSPQRSLSGQQFVPVTIMGLAFLYRQHDTLKLGSLLLVLSLAIFLIVGTAAWFIGLYASHSG